MSLTRNSELIHLDHHDALLCESQRSSILVCFRPEEDAASSSQYKGIGICHLNDVCKRLVLKMPERGEELSFAPEIDADRQID